jgi:hypothetical protein
MYELIDMSARTRRAQATLKSGNVVMIELKLEGSDCYVQNCYKLCPSDDDMQEAHNLADVAVQLLGYKSICRWDDIRLVANA